MINWGISVVTVRYIVYQKHSNKVNKDDEKLNISLKTNKSRFLYSDPVSVSRLEIITETHPFPSHPKKDQGVRVTDGYLELILTSSRGGTRGVRKENKNKGKK